MKIKSDYEDIHWLFCRDSVSASAKYILGLIEKKTRAFYFYLVSIFFEMLYTNQKRYTLFHMEPLGRYRRPRTDHLEKVNELPFFRRNNFFNGI